MYFTFTALPPLSYIFLNGKVKPCDSWCNSTDSSIDITYTTQYRVENYQETQNDTTLEHNTLIEVHNRFQKSFQGSLCKP